MNQTYDVIIIGAGPAGSTCALSLKNAGLRVALLDKRTFPRTKICGDAIPGPAIKKLNSIFEKENIGAQDWDFGIPIGKSMAVLFSEKQRIEHQWVLPAYNIPRTVFDNKLLQLVKSQTTTDIFLGSAIKKISHNDLIEIEDASGNLKIHGKMIIGCDGKNSIVARTLAPQLKKNRKSGIAVRAYFENVDNPDNANYFYMMKEHLPGYFWIFPLGENKFNVGFGFINHKNDDTRKKIKQIFQDIIADHPLLKSRFKNATMPGKIEGCELPIYWRKTPISGETIFILRRCRRIGGSDAGLRY